MASTKVAPKVNNIKFVIDCSAPAKDGILDVAAFEKYLHDRVKVEGRTGNLANNVKLSRSTDGKITVSSKVHFSKRYFKYLSKRFLKKNNLRDWLRVVASNKNTYQLRYFNIANQGNEEDEE